MQVKILIVVITLMITSPLFAAEESGRSTPQGEWTPRPDPTLLTTQNLQREVAALKEIIIVRLEGMDKAILLLQSKVDREPQISVVASQLTSLREIMMERFTAVAVELEAVQRQFTEKDAQLKETSQLVKSAVDTALKAQSESAAKTETNFTKLIDQLVSQFQTGARSTDEKITLLSKGLDEKLTALNKVNDEKNAALDTRLTRVESIAQGIALAKTDTGASVTLLLAIFGAFLGTVGMVTTLILAFKNLGNRPRAENGNR